MKKIDIIYVVIVFLTACQKYPQQDLSFIKPLKNGQQNQSLALTAAQNEYGEALLRAEKEASTSGKMILQTGRKMSIVDREIVKGGCWNFIDAVYNRAGFPTNKRQKIFNSKKQGPYADLRLVQPGDWLYYINHSYNGIEHSAIFVTWLDIKRKKGLMLSYGGENRQEPARYLPYDLSNVYMIIRAK